MKRDWLVLLPLLLAGSHASEIENVGKQRLSKKFHEHAHVSGGGIKRQRPTKEYMYVYDMPAKYTADIRKLSPEWHPDQYDFDQVCRAVMRAQHPAFRAKQ